MMLKVAARFPVTSEFIISHASGSTNLYKQHIMHALMDAGYTDELFGELHHTLFSTDSESNILAPTKHPGVQEVIDEIHGAGGIAVLAHPGKFDNFEEIDKYIEMGLDGIEVWSPFNTEEQTQELSQICKKKKLLLTGGSDFHGTYGEKTVTIGSYATPQEHLDKLMGYKAKKKRAQRKAEKEAAAKKENE